MFAVYQAACRTTNINSVYTRYSFPRDLWPRRRAVREPISRRNSFSPPRRPIFNSKRRNELFSAPFQRIYPPSPAEFRDAGSSLGSHLRHDPTRHHVNSIRDGSSLANNFELRAVSRVYMYVCIPCTRIICTRVCVRMCTYVRRSLVPVQRSKPTNPLPRGQQGDARIHFFFFHHPCVSLSPIFSSVCFRISIVLEIRKYSASIRFEGNVFKSIHSSDQSR